MSVIKKVRTLESYRNKIQKKAKNSQRTFENSFKHSATFELVPNFREHQSNIFKLDGLFSQDDTRRPKMIFSLNNDTQQIRLTQNRKKIGEMRYVFRRNRLEEIEGKIWNNKIILDPIWSPSNKIGSETLRIGILKSRATVEIAP